MSEEDELRDRRAEDGERRDRDKRLPSGQLSGSWKSAKGSRRAADEHDPAASTGP